MAIDMKTDMQIERPKRHYPSAVYRYREKHPAVTIRFTKDVFEKLKELQKTTGKSLSQLVRENLKVQEANEKSAYNKGFQAAKQKYLVSYPCCVCVEVIEVNSPEEKKAIAKYMKENNWGHKACHDGKSK